MGTILFCSHRLAIMVESGLSERVESRYLLYCKLRAIRVKAIDDKENDMKGMATIELSFVISLFIWTTVSLFICLFCFAFELILFRPSRLGPEAPTGTEITTII